MIGGGGGNNREVADQWLVTSEKLLPSSDFHGAKTFAIRACEADPSRADSADYILAISDTLVAGESTVGDSKFPDWYSILRLSRLIQNPEYIATQYSRLALLLNPKGNHLPFADQSLKLVSDAWRVLSDPPTKSMYDRELQLSQIGQLGQPHSPIQSQAKTSEEEKPMATSFWTACPYCFSLFEYPKDYEECRFRCQQCRRAFEAVTTQTPPVDSSWAMFPLGVSNHAKASSAWSPISSLFVCPVQKSSDEETTMKAPPRNDIADDDKYVEISDDDIYVAISDDD